MDKINHLIESGIVSIIRGARPEDILSITEALLKGGVMAVEVTADSPGITGSIEAIRKEFGSEMAVGVGTVLDPETARITIMSGAEFVISPSLNVETIRMTKRYGVVSIPGVFTTTEMMTAHEAGADIMKVFPARALGPSFIKDVLGPLGHLRIMPTGGIDLDNMEDYFKVGAVAVGIGGSLVNGKKEMTNEELTKITVRAKAFMDKFKEIKQS
ncbi:MAG: bifunctional 4-hydroxy-2-oxoglutarate aldolase/2-dehydro-3-deoxy-phosphogluconate aldolase [Bacillus sp. (in: Bacteria)]|nr:bifunctional 4-hydroxy-2-oxoglutarate aldolase/2-dehydro-3-deoxy-phosphogluconate aldolase [Bacillus sp. (in: firmicutes)]